MLSEPDIIIIGAGAAGLSAARELRQRGLSYTLVEGSHRIGGRAYSEEIAPGVWFDLGCSYLHQGDTNPFATIADALGVVIGRAEGNIFEPENVRLHRNGQPLSVEDTARHNRYKQSCYEAIQEASEREEDAAIADLIDLDNEFAQPFMSGMAGSCAQDIDQLSAKDIASFGSGPDIPILNGYGNLVAQWAHDVDVSLNTRVDRIDWSGEGITVETSKGNLKARAVLSTVSNGILTAGDIRFTPDLPDWKTEAFMNLPIGTLNKTCVHFDKDVFGPDGRGFHNTWNDSGDESGNGCGIEASVMGLNTAVTFLGGRQAIWLEKQGQQAGHDFAVDRIAEVFGNGIRKHVTRSIVTAWTTEPWTRGSYASSKPGQSHQRIELARPIDDRLFFAGEATIVGPQACGHGAFLSGIRAAEEIANVLG